MIAPRADTPRLTCNGSAAVVGWRFPGVLHATVSVRTRGPGRRRCGPGCRPTGCGRRDLLAAVSPAARPAEPGADHMVADAEDARCLHECGTWTGSSQAHSPMVRPVIAGPSQICCPASHRFPDGGTTRSSSTALPGGALGIISGAWPRTASIRRRHGRLQPWRGWAGQARQARFDQAAP
jgi:hypothetical protein